MMQDMAIIIMEVDSNSYVIYRISTFPMTLSDSCNLDFNVTIFFDVKS